MKYYSEITDQIYDTEEECKQAESDAREETDLKNLAAELDKAKANFEQVKEEYLKAVHDYREAYSQYTNMRQRIKMKHPDEQITSDKKVDTAPQSVTLENFMKYFMK